MRHACCLTFAAPPISCCLTCMHARRLACVAEEVVQWQARDHECSLDQLEQAYARLRSHYREE